jgi:hypothetical protein
VALSANFLVVIILMLLVFIVAMNRHNTRSRSCSADDIAVPKSMADGRSVVFF